MFHFLIKVENLLRKGITIITVISFAVSSFLYVLEMFLRLFFQTKINGINEIAQALFILSALMGSAYAVKTKEYIKIEILKSFKSNNIASLSTKILSVLVTGLFLYIFIHFTFVNRYLELWKISLDIGCIYLFFVSLVSFIVSLLETLSKKEKAV